MAVCTPIVRAMEIALIIAMLALIAVICGLAWLFVRSESRSAEAHAEMLRVSKEYANAAMKQASDAARLQPKYADKMLESLARGITDVTRGTAEAMKAIYGPVQQAESATSTDYTDLPTPWYAHEGALDDTDPTDRYLVQDPVERPDNLGGLGGALLMDGDDEPFGIPGLVVGG